MIGTVGCGRIVTREKHIEDERRRAEVALAKSEKRLRSILNSINDLVFVFDREQRFTHCYSSVEKLFVPPEAFLGQKHSAVMPAEVDRQFCQAFAACCHGDAAEYEYQIAPGDQWYAAKLSPIVTNSEFSGVVAVVRDISEYKRVELALRKSEARYRTIFETAGVSIWEEDFSEIVAVIAELKTQGIRDFPGYLDQHPELIQQCASSIRVLDVNNATLSLYEASSKSELLGSLEKIVLPETMQIIRDEMIAIASGQTFFAGETINQTLTGKPINILLTVQLPSESQRDANVLVSIMDIGARKQVEAALQRQLQELSVLSQVASIGAETIHRDTLIERVTQVIGETLFPDNIGIMLLDETIGALRVHPSYRGLVQNPELLTIPVGSGVTGHVAADGLPRRVSDVTRDPLYLQADARSQSELCVPLKVGERVLGVINAESTRLAAFSEADEQLLIALAGQLATALQRVALYEELQRSVEDQRQRLAELEAVSRISLATRAVEAIDELLPRLLDETLATIGTEAGAIFLFTDPLGVLRPVVTRGWFVRLAYVTIDIERDAIESLFSAGQAYIARDLFAEPRLLSRFHSHLPDGWGGAVVPIHAAHTIVGMMIVSLQLPREFTRQEVKVLETLTELAGSAIHRARLHEQTGLRLQRLTALRSIDQAISASVDLRVTLDILLGQVVMQLGVDAADVLLLKPRTFLLEFVAGHGFRTHISQSVAVRLGDDYAGRAALERRTIFISNLSGVPGGFKHPRSIAGEGFVAYYGIPLVAKGEVKGVLEIFHRAQLESDPEWIDFLETLSNQAAIAIDNASLFENLQQSNIELMLAYDATIEGWSNALDLREHETAGHAQRMTDLAIRLARALGFNEKELIHVKHGALLHDIGKMGIPDSILQKPGPLTGPEWDVMKQHPVLAYGLLSPIAFLRPALEIPYGHHERWDGSGYPQGLKGEQIPLAARMFAVVDSWDALLSDRPFRAAWPINRVREHLLNESGKQFDPQIVRVFLSIVGQD
jgi:PAS domain S-box-containing protein